MTHVQADLILGVGTRFGELAMWGRPPLWGDPAEQPTIQIESNPANIGLNRPVDVALIGDAKVVMAQLLEAVQELSEPKAADPRLADLQMFRAQWWQGLAKDIADKERSPMLTGQILKVCNEFFPDDAIICPGWWQYSHVVDALYRATHTRFSSVYRQYGLSGHRFAICHWGKNCRTRSTGLLRVR